MVLGIPQVYTKNLDELKFKDGKRFQKSTQYVYPEKFIKWINGEDSTTLKNKFKKTKRFTKGHKRWIDLPKTVEVYKAKNAD